MPTKFDLGEGGPGGWLILDEPEIRLGNDTLVPDIAGWKKKRLFRNVAFQTPVRHLKSPLPMSFIPSYLLIPFFCMTFCLMSIFISNLKFPQGLTPRVYSPAVRRQCDEGSDFSPGMGIYFQVSYYF